MLCKTFLNKINGYKCSFNLKCIFNAYTLLNTFRLFVMHFYLKRVIYLQHTGQILIHTQLFFSKA